MVISLISKLMAEPTNLSHQHIEVLDEFCGNPENTKRRSLLLKTCQSCLLLTLKNKLTREVEWVDPVIGVMVSFRKASTAYKRVLYMKKNCIYLAQVQL